MKVWHAGMKDRFEVLMFRAFYDTTFFDGGFEWHIVKNRLFMAVSDRASQERRRHFVFEFGMKPYFGGEYLNLDEITRIRESITKPDGSVSHWKVLPLGMEREQAKRAFSANIKMARAEATLAGLIPFGAEAV